MAAVKGVPPKAATRKHPTTRVVLYDGTVLPEIDRKMADIIQMLNRPGLRTCACCQGNRTDHGPTAYVLIEGPLAHTFCHLLLDDQIEVTNKVTYYEPSIKGRVILDVSEGITVDRMSDDERIAIRWYSCYHKFMTQRFQRVSSALFREQAA